MDTEEKKYTSSKLYLKELVFFNGEYDITFNIVDINTEKMVITLAVTKLGKSTHIEFDLLRDKENNLYIEYGCDYSKIKIDDFED